MGCACRQSRAEAQVKKQILETAAKGNSSPTSVANNNMGKLVNFEGKMVPLKSLPQGSVHVRGVWYSSMDSVPADIKKMLRESSRETKTS